jgi:SAM-dependent methyltransferase
MRGLFEQIQQITPHRNEISDTMAPYVVQRLSIQSEEWRTDRRKALGEWRRRLWLRRIQSLRFKLKREQTMVREKYSSGWEEKTWPSRSNGRISSYDWQSDGLKAHFWGIKRVHQRLIWRCVRALRPASVLEVGFGNGLNLLALSTAFPGVRWAGVELSPTGVARAKEAQRQTELPAEIASFCSWPNEAPQAYHAIDFREGDARQLPFDDCSFEMVFTLLALEQMEAIRDLAISEIARVSSRWLVMIEPFADFNRDPLRRTYSRAKGYLSLAISDLKRFGLTPILAFDDIPHKITRGAGLVVATRLNEHEN